MQLARSCLPQPLDSYSGASDLFAQPVFSQLHGYGLALAAIILAVPGKSPAETATTAAPAHRHHRVAEPANPKLPSIFIIGDSTVRNGEGTGTGGQWGWGDLMAPYFETNSINVVNRALGGTSSRTFYRDQWPAVRAMLKPGDFVIMQFGHNDSSPINDARRARGTIKGVGNETETINNLVTGRTEIVHTFGWYERRMVEESRAHGAVPMVCSLIPRNRWKDGRVLLNKGDYAGWAEEVAKSENAPFLDLNGVIGHEYDEMGQEKVQPLFVAGAGPHTSLAGAETNAICVVAALKRLKSDPLAPYFSKEANGVAPAEGGDDEAGGR